MKTIHIIVKGKVQGVFFRASAQNNAKNFGLKGWVANTADGNVEIVITGDIKQLEQYTDWCYKGSLKSIVKEVLVSNIPLQIFNDFTIAK